MAQRRRQLAISDPLFKESFGQLAADDRDTVLDLIRALPLIAEVAPSPGGLLPSRGVWIGYHVANDGAIIVTNCGRFTPGMM